MAKNTQKRSINFSTETLESLDKLAAKKHTTASELVRGYVDKGLSIEGNREDIDFMAACGFIMGVQKGYMAMIAGLTLAVMIQKVYVRESEKGFALVPYLSIGCLLAMLL